MDLDVVGPPSRILAAVRAGTEPRAVDVLPSAFRTDDRHPHSNPANCPSTVHLRRATITGQLGPRSEVFVRRRVNLA